MQIMIDISEDHFKTLQAMSDIGLGYYYDAILKGIILPSNCGRLIDERDLLGRLEIYNTKDEMDQAHYRFTKAFIACTPAVIPANKKSEDNVNEKDNSST